MDESLAARRRAHSAYLAAGDRRAAARAAWNLAVEFGFRGDQVVAGGWVSRAKRDLEREPECVEHGYLAAAECHLAQERGDLDEALALGEGAAE